MKNRSKFLTSTLLAAAAMSFCTTSANAADLTWEGIDDNNSWDGVSNNWSGDSKFSSGDSATSDDTEESSEEVPVEEEEITAGTIEIGSVDGTGGETTFGGSGSITIFATYSDVMWLTTTYEDDVYVTSGTMEISDGETIFKGGVYVGGGTLGEEGSITITGGTTTFNGSVSVSGGSMVAYGSITIAGGTTTFNSSVSVTGGNSTGGDGSITITGGTTTFGGSVSVSGGGLTGGSASITINGGTTTFNGSVSVSGGYSTSGSLTISGGETTFNGIVSVSGSSGSNLLRTRAGSLSLTGGTITLSEAISNSGTITIADSVVFVLDNLEASNDGTTYTLISGEGTINDWDTLTKSNFSLNGKGLGRSTVNVTTAGQVTVTFVDAATLVWNGTSGDNVWTNDGGEIWLNGGSTADAFVQNDNVTFGSDGTKSVSIVGKIEAGSVTVTGSGYTFTFSEDSSVTADSLAIDSGASLTLAGSGELTTSSATISGSLAVSGASLTASSVEVSSSLEVSDGSLNAEYLTVKTSGKATLSCGTVNIDSVIVEGSGSLAVSGASLTASSVDVSGSLEVSNGSLNAESLTVETSGKATLSGGTVNIDSVIVEESGSLSITGSETTITDLTSSGTVSVSTDASLELSGTIDLSSAITNEGTITLGDSVVFVLNEALGTTTGDGTLYTFIKGDVEITGWDDLTYSNFSIGDETITSARQIEFTETDGSIIYHEDAVAADLVWNGVAGDVWSDGTEDDLPQDWTNGNRADAFYNGDNVTFADVDGVTKSVTISGTVEAGTVMVTGAGYTFSFDEESSLKANSLTIDSGASLTLAGSGELTTSSATINGTLEITSGEATITTVEVSSEGTLKVSGGTTTADSIEVAGSIELTGGELTVKTIALSDSSSGSFSGGILNVSEITGDGSISFGDGLTVNLYDTTSLNADITLSGNVTFNAEDDETIELGGTLSGSGKLVKDGEGTLTVSGEENAYTGGTTISSGTIVAQSENALGTGAVAIDDGATLEIPTSREFTNATSGNGTLSITNDATVSFGSNVGVKTVEVTSGTTLSGATTLTHSNAQLVLAGTLALDASAGEKISFSNGGTVTLESSATLNLSSVSPTSVRPLSNSSEIGPGSSITIFSGATIEGDIAKFLATDNTLSTLADTYAVVYDPDKGLTVTILESGSLSSLTSGLKLRDGIGSDFISASISDDDLDFGTGIKSYDELSNPIVRALVTGNISEVSKMFDVLAPNDYAAMVAMPTTSFYNDVKAIDNRLAARRGPIDENARWEFFVQAQGTFIENDDANDTQTFDFDLYGVLAGADYRVNEGLTVGVTVGYDYGKADIHNSGGKIESDDVRITVFAGQQIGEMFFVNAGAQVGYGHYEAKRKTPYGNANGDTDGWNAGVFADVGMMLTLSEELKIAARPYVGLAYLHSEVGSFDDNLFDVDDFHGDSLRASIGCGLFWGFDLAETAWTVGLDASYSHDFCGDEVDIDATYMSTGKDFGLTAKALSKDIFSVGPTVSVGITKSIDIFAGYAFQAGTDSSTGHNVYLGVRASF